MLIDKLGLRVISVHRYPPGDGDVFQSLLNSGKLDELLSQVDPSAQIVSSWTVFYLFIYL